jgi:hypothetical protein
VTELADRLRQIDPADGVEALRRLTDLFQDRGVRGAQDCLDPAALVARVRARLESTGLDRVRRVTEGARRSRARFVGHARGGVAGREGEAVAPPSGGTEEPWFAAVPDSAEVVPIDPRGEWRFTPRFLTARARLALFPRAVTVGILASLMDGTVLPRGEGGNVSSYDFLVEGEGRLCILIASGEHGRRRWCVAVDLFSLDGRSDPDEEEQPLPRERIEKAQEQWDRWVGAQRSADRGGS